MNVCLCIYIPYLMNRVQAEIFYVLYIRMVRFDRRFQKEMKKMKKEFIQFNSTELYIAILAS